VRRKRLSPCGTVAQKGYVHERLMNIYEVIDVMHVLECQLYVLLRLRSVGAGGYRLSMMIESMPHRCSIR
jgi:hypothetical protein